MAPPRFLRPWLSRISNRHILPVAQTRTYHATRPVHSSWSPSPAPPRLPKEEQELFERLQAQSTGAFSSPAVSDRVSLDQTSADSGPGSGSGSGSASGSESAASNANTESGSQETSRLNARVDASGGGRELHPDIRRGSKDEFEGERNPVTGEVGGPKREPLRWGHGGDWSYNGRVTDF